MSGDLFSDARRHAAMVREYHDAYMAMGFDDDQSFELVAILVRAVADASASGLDD